MMLAMPFGDSSNRSRQDPYNLLSSMPREPPSDLTADDFNREWSQWMRWDDPPATAANANANANDQMEEVGNIRPTPLKEESLRNPQSSDRLVLNTNLARQHGATQQSNPMPTPSTFFMGSPFEPEPPLRNPFESSSSMRRPLLQRGPGSFDSISTTTPITSGTTKKRKCSTEEDAMKVVEAVTDAKKLPAKKRSHNVIEKRYRANLNDKIAELRDSVPSLRASQKQSQGNSPDHPDDDEDLEGVTPANKLNKASILSKATEYIHHLEMRNRKLDKENVALKARLRKLERMLEQNATATSQGSCGMSIAGSPSSSSITTNATSPPMAELMPEGSPSSASLNPPQGLIQVPEYIRRLRPTGPQPHYADSHVSYRSPDETSSSPGSDSSGRRRSFLPNRFMVGSLAGLMLLEGFTVHRKKPEHEDRGLFAVPLDMFDTLCFLVESSKHYQTILASSWQFQHAFHLVKFLFFVASLFFVIFLYLFNSRPKGSSYALKAPKIVRAPSLASPIEVRRQAWLTSIQTVWVPRHTFFPEWFALTARSIEYALRCVMGRRAFFWLTGRNREQENARIKAWDIAIDAQLTGGDSEVSRSRLVLTIFAAGTLPDNAGTKLSQSSSLPDPAVTEL